MPILQNDVDLSLLDHEMTSQAFIVETRVLTALVCTAEGGPLFLSCVTAAAMAAVTLFCLWV